MIRLFADDTRLYIIVENPISAADELNADLAKMLGQSDGLYHLTQPNMSPWYCHVNIITISNHHSV